MLLFKDQLVRSKYLEYQSGLEKSVFHIGYGKRYGQLSETEDRQWEIFRFKLKEVFQLCKCYHCHKTPMQYNSYYGSAYISYPSFDKNYHDFIKYITYNAFKNDRRTNLRNLDNIRFKDELFF